jgi:hypothetical protein
VKKTKKASSQSVLAFPSNRAGTPEPTAKRAVARMPTTVSDHRVKLTPTLFLSHDVAEYVVAMANEANAESRLTGTFANNFGSAAPLYRDRLFDIVRTSPMFPIRGTTSSLLSASQIHVRRQASLEQLGARGDMAAPRDSSS